MEIHCGICLTITAGVGYLSQWMQEWVCTAGWAAVHQHAFALDVAVDVDMGMHCGAMRYALMANE